MRNVITQAVNGRNEMLKEVDIFERAVLPGDRFLLCSDGLWVAYPDMADLEERIAASNHPGDLCWQLVAEANQRDGSDNISAVAVFAA
jgi:serine/threonine protein phosphatase PrpC